MSGALLAVQAELIVAMRSCVAMRRWRCGLGPLSNIASI